MESYSGDQNNHFPVDRDAPASGGNKNDQSKKIIDIIVFLLIAGATVLTVSLSLYIIFSKFF
ncbi:MAG TPA: hypothetical protein PKA90_11810 [Ignavibacteria bacterium]|nr:hypothetical protein [Ignavibacteria bacterium]HMR41105.1 hypothetical protein [Ignavibacteria bacterium]